MKQPFAFFQVIGDMSQELVPFFEAPTIVEHPGGHFIPATSRFQKNDYSFNQIAFKLKLRPITLYTKFHKFWGFCVNFFGFLHFHIIL